MLAFLSLHTGCLLLDFSVSLEQTDSLLGRVCAPAGTTMCITKKRVYLSVGLKIVSADDLQLPSRYFDILSLSLFFFRSAGQIEVVVL